MLTRPQAPFDRARDQVEAMMRSEERFAEVERAIDHAPLPRDRRDALWLVAWSLSNPRRRRRDEFREP